MNKHSDRMVERLTRRLVFSRAPLKGYYRFGDIFQLTPAPDNWHRPPTIMGDYPLILELSYDPKIAPDRESDLWRRDLFERDREKKLVLSQLGLGSYLRT